MTGMEPFVDPLASGLVGVLIDTAKKVGGGFAQTVGDRRRAAAALKEYADKYVVRYGVVRLLGMRQEMSLEEVYTKVRFLDELSIRQFISLEALEQNYREGQKRRFQIQQTAKLDGFKVANDERFLMVLGGPGAGKSTFLRRVGLEALKGDRGSYRHYCIPVMLELKRFNTDKVDLTQAITNELQNFGFPSSPEFAIKLLEQGKLLLLLDGLDEVPKSHQNGVIESIQDLVTKYDRNRYISSCRIAAHRSTWNRFRDIELADFDDNQIRQFIYNWFKSEYDQKIGTAQKCWDSLNELSNTAAKELAQTPLLLTFLCMVYDRTQGFPANRAILYRKALDILLEEWASEKRVYRDSVYEGLNPELEKVLLSEIAYNGFVNNQFFFTQRELVSQIKKFLSDTVDKPKYLDGKAVLDAIAVQQGVLVERAEDIFSFSHLTLQEYLVAQYISEDNALVEAAIKQNLVELNWREVFLLIAGLTRNSDKLLEQMELVAQEYINSSKLKALIEWADQLINRSRQGENSTYDSVLVQDNLEITSFEDEVATSAKRAAAILLALTFSIDFAFNADSIIDFTRICADAFTRRFKVDLSAARDFSSRLSNDLAFARNFNFELVLNLAYQFQEVAKIFEDQKYFDLMDQLRAAYSKAPSSEESLEIRQRFSEKILKIWFEALDLQQELVDLSEGEAKALSNYLYANELIVRCKEAAVRVSATVWRNIERRMITKINYAP